MAYTIEKKYVNILGSCYDKDYLKKSTEAPYKLQNENKLFAQKMLKGCTVHNMSSVPTNEISEIRKTNKIDQLRQIFHAYEK